MCQLKQELTGRIGDMGPLVLYTASTTIVAPHWTYFCKHYIYKIDTKVGNKNVGFNFFYQTVQGLIMGKITLLKHLE